ncbi:alpha-1,3-arabinosyltransferase XAT3-like [Telopea speciosissima]|uniref:alpha-1,3-arabinosyltransferase XAT3-like n=1 Tax=Telopea speciosissima TaxID=54955 RepID=UPI001CC66992|nr:alpha-1,3-arabinosyltransferase XAT3-like [Telopea speciosissima]
MKNQAILKQLSRYEIINIDTEDKVHCFPHLIVGLKHYKELRIDPLTASKGYSMKEFRQLIRNAYSLKKLTAIKIGSDSQEKPRFLILTRTDTRKFLNVDEIAELAKSMGFEVVVSEAMTDLDKFSHIVNSCDVMMGIHGAGLTNLVFLPNNAILIQVLPLGRFEWLASNCFGDPALDMELRYMEYQIKEEESSLIEQYPLDHLVFKDPHSIHKDDWGLFKSVYLDKQDVKFNVSRFKSTLIEVLELLHH